MSSLKSPVYLTRCEHLAAFSVAGTDARSFLQSQLTQDIESISYEQAALAGFCTAQGRLWASMLLTRGVNQEEFLGIASADLLESFLKRLRMFVLRSKVVITVPDVVAVYGIELAVDDLTPLAATTGAALPQATWGSVASAFGQWVRLPPTADTSRVRLLLLATAAQFEQIVGLLGEQAQTLPSSDRWQVQDIKTGLAWVEAATQDLFIAQTLNLDLIGAVSFTKGCYPGQEVIARAHYRGTVKRRMHLASVAGSFDSLKAGMDVFEATEPDNPVGRLIAVASEPSGAGGSDLAWVLFEAPFKSLEGLPLRAASANGPELTVQPLPYEVAQQ